MVTFFKEDVKVYLRIVPVPLQRHSLSTHQGDRHL